MWVRGLGIEGPEPVDRARKLEGDELRGYHRQRHRLGPVTHVRPAVRLSATPARWERPVVPLGTHPAAWPD